MDPISVLNYQQILQKYEVKGVIPLKMNNTDKKVYKR